MKAKFDMQKLSRILFIVLIAAMLFLFFANDFGLVDIHKASIVVAMGIDVQDEGVSVTVQAAVPAPAQQGGSGAAYTQVTGEGASVADALDDINAKTGFYPKLAFCNLVLLGSSCTSRNIFDVLDYFYRGDYVPLTALVGLCSGGAEEALSQKPSDGGMSASAISRAMSEELRKSANACTVNLKMLAQCGGDVGGAAYMPYVQSSDGASSGGQAGTGSQSSGAESPSGEEGGSAGFTCLQTAAFSQGQFVGVLDEEQSFAFNLVKNPVRLAVVNAQCGGITYTLGLKNCRSSLSARVEGGAPVLKITFSARASVQSAEGAGVPSGQLVPQEVLSAAEEVIGQRLNSLASFCTQSGCDLLGAGGLLFRHAYSDFASVKDNLLNSLKVEADISLASVK